LLSGADGIEVIAELQRGDQVVSASRVLRPDVAVLAAMLPGLDGFAAAHALHAELPSCNSLIMSEQRDPGHLRRAVASHAVHYQLMTNVTCARRRHPEILSTAVQNETAQQLG
jgi:two-component system response regulator DesR